MKTEDAIKLAETIMAIAQNAQAAGQERIDLDELAAEDDKARAALQGAIDKASADTKSINP